MSEQSALKRNLTPLNIVTALVLMAGTVFLVMQPKPEAAVPDEGVLFTLAGKEYRNEDLPMRYSQTLYQRDLEAYNARMGIVQAAAIEVYLDQEATKTGKTREEVAQELFRVAQPSEEQLRSFYESNKGAINATYEQARPQIGNYLMQMAQQQQQNELVQKLVSLNELTFTLNPPESPSVEIDTTGYPSKGPADAKVTVVEFADYQCPHCKEAHETLKPVLEPYLDRVRFVYMDFPINRSGISRKVAEGAACADAQGKFWEYQDSAFAQQATLSMESPRQLAEALALDLEVFDRCVADQATADKVKHAERQAIESGVTGTPTFFVNGQKQHLHDAANELPALIDLALQLTR